MQIKKLFLQNFRNYENEKFEFDRSYGREEAKEIYKINKEKYIELKKSQICKQETFG